MSQDPPQVEYYRGMGYNEACKKLVPDEQQKYYEVLQVLQSMGYSDFCENLRKLRTLKGDYLNSYFSEDAPVEEAPKPMPFNPSQHGSS